MDPVHQAEQIVDAARRAEAEDCYTIKEFAALVRMSESAIREAIREARLNPAYYRAVQVTPRTWRIYVRKAA